MDDPFAAVRRRHPNIPQDPLPIEVTEEARAAEPTRSTPSVRQAVCPFCFKPDKTTGVIRLDDGTEVFREHNKVLTTGRRIRCGGSGQVAPKRSSPRSPT